MFGLKRRNGNGEPTLEELQQEFEKVRGSITEDEFNRAWDKIPEQLKRKVKS